VVVGSSSLPLQVDLKSSATIESVPEELVTIGELAARAGVRTSTLRHYEAEGVLRPARRVGGQRRYDASAIEALTLIRFCRRLGFSLGEIRTLLGEPRGTRKRTQWRDLVDAKLAELDESIARATAMKSVLRTSRDCDCVDLEQCAALCAPLVG
jgi:DNA-binding transcriptional MerR regulator